MPNQKIVLDNFQVGMVDEEQLSTMAYPEGAAVSAINVYYTPRGALTKRPGVEKKHTASPCSAAFTKLFQWADTSRNEYTLAFTASATTCSASIYTVGTSAGSTTFSGVNVTAGSWVPTQLDAISVASCLGSAVFTNTGTTFSPVAFSGTANCTTVTAAPSGCKTVCGYYNYLLVGNILVGGVRNGSRVQWCYPGDVNNWPVQYWLDLDPDDGDEITAMANFNNYVVVWKHNKMFVLTYVGGMEVFNYVRLSTFVGCAGPNAWYNDKDNVYFLSHKAAAYSWNGSGLPTGISGPLLNTFEDLNWPIANQFEVEGYWEFNHIYFSVASKNSTTRDLILCYDTDAKGWSIFTMAVSCMGYAVYGGLTTYDSALLSWSEYPIEYNDILGSGQEVLLMGNYNGFLGVYGQTTDDFGTSVNGYWVSRWLDMGNPDLTKRIMRITVMVDREGSYNLNVNVSKDWNTTLGATQLVHLSSPLYTTGLIEKRVDFTLQGRSFRVQIGTSDKGTPFTVHKLIIEWVQKGKTLV